MTSLYIHIPFCQKKCFYCSFVVAIAQDHRIESYLECLEWEAKKYRGMPLKTVYFGGGTPTYLNPQQLNRVLKILKENFQLKPNYEFTVEANPEGLDQPKAKFLKDLGVNRVSLGIQTLDDRYLKYLGRVHDSRRALTAFEDLRQAGFSNINVDLMYSFPDQTDEEIRKDVEKITALESEHISLYTLTIEENSRFHTKNVKLSDDEHQARQYELVTELLERTKFKQYEISNFAKPGRESQHNLNYWQGGDYLGLGVGAHSHRQGIRSWNVSKTPEYISRIEQNQSPTEGQENLSLRQRFTERLLFGLRMNQGVELKEIENKLNYNSDLEMNQKIKSLSDQNFLRLENGFLKATSKGRLVLDEISVQLI